jgi:hypothetical protein
MANIPAGSVTYTINKQNLLEDSRRMNQVTLAFGDASLTYPAGGIPITKGNLGLPTVIDSFKIMDKGTSGYEFSFDFTNTKLLMFQSGSHTHDILFKDAQTASTTLSNITLAANKLGANTGGDITITGGGTLGGVVAKTIGALSEASAVAIAAQTIIVEVIWYENNKPAGRVAFGSDGSPVVNEKEAHIAFVPAPQGEAKYAADLAAAKKAAADAHAELAAIKAEQEAKITAPPSVENATAPQNKRKG